MAEIMCRELQLFENIRPLPLPPCQQDAPRHGKRRIPFRFSHPRHPPDRTPWQRCPQVAIPRPAPHHHPAARTYGDPVPTTPTPPAPPGDGHPPTTTHVWWWKIPPERSTGADLAILDTTERKRVDQLKSASAAAEFITCRAAVRRILSEYFHVPTDSITIGRKPCPGCGSEHHGPPALLHPTTHHHISISHTTGLGLLALSPYPVGADTEALRTLPTDDLAPTTTTPAEHQALLTHPPGPARSTAYLHCWTRKEAVLKATGTGLTGHHLNQLETHFWTPGPTHLTTTTNGTPTTWTVDTLPLPPGWTAALALPHHAPRHITTHPHHPPT